MTEREILIAKILILVAKSDGYWSVTSLQHTLKIKNQDTVVSIVQALSEYGFLDDLVPEYPPRMRLYALSTKKGSNDD